MRHFSTSSYLCTRTRLGGAFLLGALSTAAFAAACGSSPSSAAAGDGGGLPPTFDGSSSGVFNSVTDGGNGASIVATALQFIPPRTTLEVDGVTPRTTGFQLEATFADGQTAIVTPASVQFDRPDLASVQIGATVSLTAAGGYGGTGHLHGIYGGQEAVAELDVVVQQRDLGTVPAATATALDNAGITPTDTAVTSMLYPYDKTVFPLGITAPIVMWRAPTGGSHASDVYRLHLQEKSYSYDVYATTPLSATSPDASSAQWRIDQAVWDRITASNGGPGDPLQVVLSRYDAGTSTATASAAMTWTVAPASLRGAIYYWTASKSNLADGGMLDVGHITRMAPGTGALPVQLNSGRCMGCHAVSADGTTLVAAIDDPASAPAVPPYVLGWQRPPTRPWGSFDVSQASAPPIYQSTQYGADIALTPDGAFTVFGAPTNAVGSKVLSLSNTKTGALVTTSGLDALLVPLGTDVLSMPAFSPDGTKLVAVRSLSADDNVLPKSSKGIVTIDYNAQQQTFGSTLNSVVVSSDMALAPGETALAYPSFTPDSQYVAFHAGTHSTGCQDGCDDSTPDDGQLYIAPVSGGGAVRLAAIDDPPDPADHNTSVEPTFNPSARGGYSWVVFTSMRNWGNMGWTPSAGEDANKVENFKRRLWVAAVDPTVGTVDPSHPPFYLEGQDNTPNMRGFWASAQCIATPGAGQSDAGSAASGDGGAASGGRCTQGFECCSGFCQGGMCVDPSSLACKPVGGACSSAADCCNGASGVSCNAGACSVDAPR